MQEITLQYILNKLITDYNAYEKRTEEIGGQLKYFEETLGEGFQRTVTYQAMRDKHKYITGQRDQINQYMTTLANMIGTNLYEQIIYSAFKIAGYNDEINIGYGIVTAKKD